MEIVAYFEARCEQAKKDPFLDNQPMVGAPPRAWKNFRSPLLRQFDTQAKIIWKEQLGYGIDGIVWKAEFNGKSCTVKVFWDDVAPEGTHYWAIQRECHNAAILQMIQAAIDCADEPIYLNPRPKTKKHALINLQNFSAECRNREKLKKLPNAVPYTSLPPIKKCFGWTKVSGQELWKLSPNSRPPTYDLDHVRKDIWPQKEYFAIVYEFIPEGCLDKNVVQSQLDFYWLVGFCFTPTMRPDNWKGDGILIDMADLICPWHAGWSIGSYYRRLARLIVKEEN